MNNMPEPSQRRESAVTLDELRNTELQRLRELKYFKVMNGLTRSAHYPLSPAFHYSLILLICVAQSCAIIYLLSRAAGALEMGTVLLAFLLSVTTVGAGFLAGHVPTRYLNHPNSAARNLGIFGVTVYAISMLLLNLVAAHYRDLFASSPESLHDALAATFKQPLRISFDALLLGISGAVASTLALLMGYRADDPVPNYGRVDRHFHEARQAREAAE